MKKSGIRTVVAIGIGTALFYILSFAAIPVGFLPNTSIQTRAALLAFMSAIFGPVAGGAIGLLGHAISDALQYGSVWWSWVFPEGVLGIIIGVLASRYKIEEGGFALKEIITFNVVQAIGNVIAWVLIAPTLDIIIYAEPANKVYAQGIVSAVVNIVTIGVIGTLLGVAYTKVKAKSSSLSVEE